MQSRLAHRGPDDRGIYTSPDLMAGLVHTRLSILDLSAAGHQPMGLCPITPTRTLNHTHNPNPNPNPNPNLNPTSSLHAPRSTLHGSQPRYWITFNGEIYNFKALRSELENQGERFSSNTDTEVILRLYSRHGQSCVEKLRGMFAFAIWDNLEQTCFLARDPFGIKPLYYFADAERLVFGSEFRALLASKCFPPRVDPLGLYGYLRNGTVPEPGTMLAGVKLLEAGTTLLWRAGEVTRARYWQIHFDSHPASEASASDLTRRALMESIDHHFVSDVPVGIFLSGGIDSTAILALASKTKRYTLRTYSIALEDARLDESDAANRLSKHFGTDHRDLLLTSDLARSWLKAFLRSLDRPTIDGFNTFCVSKLASDYGTKVVLSGLGGDELFGGYASFTEVPKLKRLAERCAWSGPLGRLVGRTIESSAQNVRWRRLGEFLQRKPTIPGAFQAYRGIFTHREAIQLLCQFGFGGDEPGVYEPQMPAGPLEQMSEEDQVCALETSVYMRNQLLRDSDVMSMAFGLELRTPLVDKALFESVSRLPSSIRLAPGKQLLLQAVPEIPEWIASQPKRGFVFPFESWLKNDWDDLLPARTHLGRVPLTTWYRKWSLFILDHWLKENRLTAA